MSERQFPIGFHAMLADLHQWHVLTASCMRCGHEAELAPAYLAKRRAKTTRLAAIEQKLRCRECGGKLVRLSVRNAPR